MSRLDKVSSCASNSCVAQRQSIRLLIGRLLVRIQSQEPAPRRQSLRGFCLSKLPGLSRTKLPSSRLPTQPPAAYCAALSSRHYLQRRRHLGQPGAAPATPCTSLAPSSPCSPASSNPHSAVEPVQRRCRAPSSAPKQNPACHPKRADKRGISLSALDGAGGVNHGPPRAGNRHAVNQLGTNALGECSRQT